VKGKFLIELRFAFTLEAYTNGTPTLNILPKEVDITQQLLSYRRTQTFRKQRYSSCLSTLSIFFQELVHWDDLCSYTLDRVETILHHKAECGVCAVPLHAENLHTPPNFAHHILYRKIVFKSSLFAYFVHDEIVSFLSALDLPSYLEY
jgi:hypothetical protein